MELRINLDIDELTWEQIWGSLNKLIQLGLLIDLSEQQYKSKTYGELDDFFEFIEDYLNFKRINNMYWENRELILEI